MDVKVSSLLDLTKTIASALFDGIEYPWQVLDLIKDFTIKLGQTLPADEYECSGENVWIAKDAVVYPTVSITGPCIIDHGAEIRQCAFIRGSAIVGKNAVVGNSVELKNVILFAVCRRRTSIMSAILFLVRFRIWVQALSHPT